MRLFSLWRTPIKAEVIKTDVPQYDRDVLKESSLRSNQFEGFLLDIFNADVGVFHEHWKQSCTVDLINEKEKK